MSLDGRRDDKWLGEVIRESFHVELTIRLNINIGTPTIPSPPIHLLFQNLSCVVFPVFQPCLFDVACDGMNGLGMGWE